MSATETEWFAINNIGEIDSPALVVYRHRVEENIRLLKSRVKDISLLRPHVKTSKMAEVCQLMVDKGIYKFKCATIAEAEMLALLKAPDILLACQPVGPKIQRLVKLVKAYPFTRFSCVIDNVVSAGQINEQCIAAGIRLDVFIDLNTGMNRTGIQPDRAFELFRYCQQASSIFPLGLHAYDGHIGDTDINLRIQKVNAGFVAVEELLKRIDAELNISPVIVAGGSVSFGVHVLKAKVEVSPGTFVFWDHGYHSKLPDEPYQYAALVITRVISVIDECTICTDLGHKSVAAENPLPRVYFLNAQQATPLGQNEEHLVLAVPDAAIYQPGDVLYAVPVHICPTIALYEEAIVVENHTATGTWNVVARNRKLSI